MYAFSKYYLAIFSVSVYKKYILSFNFTKKLKGMERGPESSNAISWKEMGNKEIYSFDIYAQIIIVEIWESTQCHPEINKCLI